MTWTDAMSTGNAEVDGQHKRLVELLNQLHEAMRAGQGAATLNTVFDELIAYTGYHFQTEEALFAATEYPLTAVHKQQHAELVRQAKDLQAQFRAGDAFVTAEVLTFLKDWVGHHILETDLTLKGVI